MEFETLNPGSHCVNDSILGPSPKIAIAYLVKTSQQSTCMSAQTPLPPR